MPARLLICLMLLATISSQAQYKNDNNKYKTVFLEDLCRTMQNNSNYILLDVRTKGEYCDTSSSTSLNIGHLKNAVNIDVQELPQRLDELKEDKNKAIFVYCSHSQRSRRASALLADSGFTRVFNINGGLTTFNLLKERVIPCAVSFYETNNKFSFLSPQDFIAAIEKNKNVFILDIRKDSVYNGISSDEKLNAYGKLKNAVNIPFSSLEVSLQKISKNNKIIIVDDYGIESPGAAEILFNNGYNNVSVLFNGMDRWAGTEASELPEKEKNWIHPSDYKLITGDEFDEMARKKNDMAIIDVRIAEEFNNKSKQEWRNRGNIKNAINIPLPDLSSRINELEKFKNKPVIVYHFGSSAESFKAARQLTQAGFKNVNLLMGGIWDLRWRAANIKGKSKLNDWVENIPAANL